MFAFRSLIFYLRLIGTYYVVVAGTVGDKFIIIFVVMVIDRIAAQSRKGLSG